MTINYGKRKAGALTAASPGDTLYIPFASYNDSGDSEGMSGFAVGDIEIFKNGNAVPRATDSGYSLISDTGQYGDRIGLYRFSVQLFNTSDDTGFYDTDSQYHVAVDSVTIDGKTVRHFPAIFEIDNIEVDVTRVTGDTGAAKHLAQMADKYDTGTIVDTGRMNQAVWQGNATRTLTAFAFDTGVQQKLDRMDTGLSETIDRIEDFDTGMRALINRFDTGVQETIDRIEDFDTGLRQLVNRFDTGVSAKTDQTYAKLDTGISAEISAVDTGLRQLITRFDTGVNQTIDAIEAHDTGLRQLITRFDTGVNQTIDAIEAHDTGLRQLINRFDTGVQETIDRIEDFDTGLRDLVGSYDTGARAILDKIQFDTGANEIHVDIRKVNNIQVTGTGDSGTEWGPV